VLHDEVHEEGVLDDADGALAQAGDESLLDHRAGGVAARVQDARVGVRRLEALHELAVGSPVEGDPEVDQLGCGLGPSSASTRTARLAEPGTCDEGVADVIGDAVVVEHDAGDPALGVPRVGVLEHVLRDEGHAASGCRGVQRRREPGDPRPDDDDVDRAVTASPPACARGRGARARRRRRAPRCG
jgi:hypothetical protein